jgi:hypothetical protein
MLRQLECLETSLQDRPDKGRILTQQELADVGSTLEFAQQELGLAKFEVLSMKAGRHIISLSVANRNNPPSVAATLQELRLDIDKELHGRQFVSIQPDRAGYAEGPSTPDRYHYGNRKHLFGDAAYAAFMSARYDMREAGNCLAVEANTAAVFHLMRVAEYGLRALAHDRRVRLPKNSSLQLATWEEIIKKLEDAVSAIQGYPRTLAREAQFEFYHGAMIEFRGFKNKFRNRVMHARDEYDRDDAHSAFTHVRAFMNTLASRITETKRTPLKWKGKRRIT